MLTFYVISDFVFNMNTTFSILTEGAVNVTVISDFGKFAIKLTSPKITVAFDVFDLSTLKRSFVFVIYLKCV